MKYRSVGKHGLRVSVVSLGSWLTYGTAVEAEAAERCIKTAVDCGINFFDTSNAYNAGEGEKALGAALRPYDRSSYVLSTKVFFPMGPGTNDRGLSRKHIFEQCDASLKRLGVDYVDIYFCHRFDSETPVEETLWALDDLVSQGKILYPAISEWTADQIQDAVNMADKRGFRPLIANQPIYNLFERYIEEDVIPTSSKAGIGQVVFSPLAGGVLTGKYKPGQPVPEGTRAADESINWIVKSYIRDDVLGCAGKLEELATRLGIKLSQLAIAWTLRQPNVCTALIGATKAAQVEENALAADIELSDTTLNEIEEILVSVKGFSPLR